MKALLDYVPLIIFFYFYKTTDPTDRTHPLLQLIGSHGAPDNNNILVATCALLISMLVVYTGLFVFQKFRLEKSQWFILAMTIVFGGITLILSDDFYIRLKAVIINVAFGLGFLLSPFILKERKPLIQRLFAAVFDLDDAGWRKLNLWWGLFFFFMASLHIFFAFILMQGKYWGEFTAFGDIIVMIIFLVSQMVILRKYIKTSA
ncbi:MAG: septation protein A [Moraxellaceae bacterium]|nr:MAG: septation protein A [Moraxellaceae bacterium]